MIEEDPDEESYYEMAGGGGSYIPVSICYMTVQYYSISVGLCK